MKSSFAGVSYAGLVAAAGIAVAALWLAPVPVAGQGKGGGKGPAKESPKGAYTAPRAGDGHADLQGIWQAWNTAAYGLEAHNAATGIHAGKSFVVDPADGMIPYLPAARKKQQENFEKREQLDTMNHCYMTGVPRSTYIHFPFQIFQTPKYIEFISEYAHMVRNIYMDKQTHFGDLEFWNGDSRGHWEGDTLVVDVADFNDQTWFDASGDHHSTALKVVERYTRTGPDVMQYEATMTDPQTFSRPWTIRMDLHRDTDQYPTLLEYECHSYFEDDAARLGSR
jgi:hypothetical protein